MPVRHRWNPLMAGLIVVLFWYGTVQGHGRDFINPEAPPVAIPAYQGERYEALVPDTLDIAERARLAIHGLTSPVDPDDYYALYWLVNFQNRPPMMRKEDYVNIGAKFREALPLMRIMCGSDVNDHVDQVWMDTLLKDIGPDGFIYQRQGAQHPRYTLHGCGIGRLMGAMMVYYLRDGDQAWLDRVRAIVDRYVALAIDKGDWAYFAASNYPVGAEPPTGPVPVPKGIWSVDGVMGRIVQPLGQFYQLTGYAPAKQLGDKLVSYLLHHADFYGPDGEWLTDALDESVYPNRGGDVHFGTHSHTLLYMLDYALCTNNQALQDYCNRSFQWALQRNSTIKGQSETATRIGFFLEYLNPYYPTCEHCSVADMVAIALKLSAAGVADYWDDADRWIRNQFVANQIQYADWTERMKSAHWPRDAGPIETADHVAERNVGGFLSWVTPNDGCQTRVMEGDAMAVAPGVSIGIMHCCTGNGTRTLYYIWENILRHEDDGLTVNLLLNRASPWADVDSYLPYTGQVEIRVKQSLRQVTVRVPEWVAAGTEIPCRVNGPARPVQWAGRYLRVGAVQPGDVVRLDYPIAETVVKRRVYGAPSPTMMGGYEYERLIFRGNTLVTIDPAGRNYPLYQRRHYRTDQPRMVRVQRLVSNDDIAW